MPRPLIAIAPFLESCPVVKTLGVRPAISDYSPDERRILASAARIFFPTPRFAKIFEAAGGNTFPNAFTYRLRKSTLLQTTLLQFSGCPHPRTRIYFGRQKASIPDDFSFPFIAMGPNRSDRARVVQNSLQLADPADRFNPLIIREYIEYEERMVLVFVNYECIAEIRNLSGEENFSAHAASFPAYCFHPPAAELLRSFQVCDIAVEVGFNKERGMLIDSFARPPLSWKTPKGVVNRHKYISDLIRKGIL